MIRKLAILMSGAVLSCMALPEAGLAADAASDRATATAVEEQALASLDDVRPLARANALKDILEGGDPILRDAAIHKVAASSDIALKTETLRWLFSRSNKSYIFTFDKCGGTIGSDHGSVSNLCSNFQQTTSASFPMIIKMEDASDGSFIIYSLAGSRKTNDVYEAGPGRVIGDRVKFNVSLVMYNGMLGNCAGDFKMNGDADMVGTMTCGSMVVSGSFSIR